MASPSTDSPFVTIMVIIILILGLAIILLANVLLGAAQYRLKESGGTAYDGQEPGGNAPGGNEEGQGKGAQGKEALDEHEQGEHEQEEHAGDEQVQGKNSQEGEKACCGKETCKVQGCQGKTFLSGIGAAVAVPAVNGLSDFTFYVIISIVFLELTVVMSLLYNIWILLGIRRKRAIMAEAGIEPAVPRISWWEKINRFKPVQEEASLDLGHDYDGIRELDNRLPPWWLYGFYCTILFACIYLWRYHVAHSAPLSAEEYRISVAEAEVRKAAYLKQAANNVDETTVKQMTEAGDLAAGQAIFESTCFACHGKHGEGGVGPNLTDGYWLHGGSIQDIFKTIKYGWPEKGMKSWKDDYSPSQIAQIASYVKSLGGTNPAGAKAPQGTLYKP